MNGALGRMGSEVIGALGRMGSEVIAAIERGFGDARLAGAADPFSAGESLSGGVKTARALADIGESADCVIDFSDARDRRGVRFCK